MRFLLRCIVATSLLVPLVAGVPGGVDDRPVYDPVVDVLNTGTVLDVQPHVSADRKYVTLGLRPNVAELAGSFIEEIRVLGGRPVTQRLPYLIGATWRGHIMAPTGSTDDKRSASLDLVGKDPGKLIHPVKQVRLLAADLDKRKLRLKITVRKPGKERKTVTGRVHDDHLRETIAVEVVADEDWQVLSGTYATRREKGTIELRRQAPAIPAEVGGTWPASEHSLRGTLNDGEGFRCDLQRKDDAWSLAIGDDTSIALVPLYWHDARRKGVFLVKYPAHGDAAATTGMLVVAWHPQYHSCGAWFANDTALKGPVLFKREKPAAEKQ